ncbi:MAG: flagellar hook assembly protein FlgD [Methylococcales bacterium]
MTTVNPYSGLGVSTLETATTTAKKTLGQEEFLKLMTTQMTHQDPTKPMENGDFLAQMAQFGTVSGIQDLQKSFKDFSASISSDQAMQAASLVGRYVSVPSELGQLNAKAGYISGTFDLPSSTSSASVKILDSKTKHVIQNIDMGQKSAGSVSFVWDGKDANGNQMPQGSYTIQPVAVLDGKSTSLQANVDSLVDSVSLGGANGIQLNLDGVGAVSFSKVKQIL